MNPGPLLASYRMFLPPTAAGQAILLLNRTTLLFPERRIIPLDHAADRNAFSGLYVQQVCEFFWGGIGSFPLFFSLPMPTFRFCCHSSLSSSSISSRRPLSPSLSIMQSAVASCPYSRAAAAAAAAPAAALALRPAARSSPLLRTPLTRAGATSLLGCRRRRQQLNLSPLLRASAFSATAEKEPPRNKTVADIMTRGVFTVTADTTVDEGAILSFFFDAKMPASDGLSGAPRSRSLTSTSASPQLVKKKKALDLLVSKRITGLPVVDGEGVVVSNH